MTAYDPGLIEITNTIITDNVATPYQGIINVQCDQIGGKECGPVLIINTTVANNIANFVLNVSNSISGMTTAKPTSSNLLEAHLPPPPQGTPKNVALMGHSKVPASAEFNNSKD